MHFIGINRKKSIVVYQVVNVLVLIMYITEVGEQLSANVNMI